MKKILNILLILSLYSCDKNNQPEPVPEPITNDAQKIKLKEVSVQGLPSPYYQYEYDAGNFITKIKHESGNYQLRIEYKFGRISRMINTIFQLDTLEYFYNEGQVSRIDLLEAGKGKTEEINLFYDASKRLVEVNWQKMNVDLPYKKMLFQYNDQNNMNRAEIYYAEDESLVKTNTYVYETFDNKYNPTSAYLLKENYIFLLPQVQLQQNNPIKFKLLGVHNDFEIDNSYQYQNSLPVHKSTSMKQVRGSEVGHTVTGHTTYSYY